MKTKNLLTVAFFLLLAAQAWSQQDPLYSQYLFNKFALNPAYAGSREQLSVNLQGRRQWAGFAGAPGTEAVTAHFPTPDLRHGFGMALVNDHWGQTQNTLVTAAYAYRIPIGPSGSFSLGLKTGVRSYRVRYQGVPLWDANDAAFNNGNNFSRGLLVVAPGAYFQNDHFFAGLSVSDILPHKLYDPRFTSVGGKSVIHTFGMLGAAIPLGNAVKLKPSVLVRAVPGAPLGLDLNLMGCFKDRISAGMTWRPGNAVAFMLQAYLTPAIQLGYSYDLGTNATRSFASGSHELMLGFDLNFLSRDLSSPKPF